MPLLLALLAGCPRPLPPTMVPDAVLTTTTDDGWSLEVRHYVGDGPPVLLVHGMGANHYNWDYRPENSLADYLVAEGWDVWVPELRGDPGSVGPTRRARAEFDFDAHALHDLPTAVDIVLDETGAEQLYWIGHSMGGMLLYTALSQYPERIRAGVAVCSPSTFTATRRRLWSLRAVGWAFGGRGRVHARAWARASMVFGRWSPVVRRIAEPDHVEASMARGLVRHALVDLPHPMVRQGAEWMRSGSFTLRDGSPWVRPVDVPLLVMGAPGDRIVAEPDVAATCDVYPDCTYRELSVAGGFSGEYGHVDPLVGSTARDEVYPVISSWLASQRGAGAW